jgi:hypothetical protein
MTNKRNRNTSKTLTQDQCALLMLVKTKPFVGKPLGQPVAKSSTIRGRRQRCMVTPEVRVCSFEESEVSDESTTHNTQG